MEQEHTFLLFSAKRNPLAIQYLGNFLTVKKMNVLQELSSHMHQFTWNPWSSVTQRSVWRPEGPQGAQTKRRSEEVPKGDLSPVKIQPDPSVRLGSTTRMLKKESVSRSSLKLVLNILDLLSLYCLWVWGKRLFVKKESVTRSFTALPWERPLKALHSDGRKMFYCCLWKTRALEGSSLDVVASSMGGGGLSSTGTASRTRD